MPAVCIQLEGKGEIGPKDGNLSCRLGRSHPKNGPGNGSKVRLTTNLGPTQHFISIPIHRLSPLWLFYIQNI